MTAVWRRVWRRLAGAARRLLPRRQNVYRRERGPGPGYPGLVVDRHDRLDDVPADARDALIRWGGEQAWRLDVDELRDGAALWIGRLGGVPAGAWMSRPGSLFRAWFVPLRPADQVLFRGRTAPDLRGRGIGPAMMAAIVERAVPPGGCAYLDVGVHNAASRRAVEKAGFRRIARMKPVSRKQAYV